MPRRSKRIAKGAGGADNGDSSDEGADRRASIGDALGLQTPNKLKGANLREARANEAAEAAARRLDSMRQPTRAKRKSHKGRKSKRQRERDRLSAIALLRQTRDRFETPNPPTARADAGEEKVGGEEMG